MLITEYIPKGHKLWCIGCGELIAQYAQDVSPGEHSPTQIFEELGQAPWYSDDDLICRKCLEPWTPEQKWFTSNEMLD